MGVSRACGARHVSKREAQVRLIHTLAERWRRPGWMTESSRSRRVKGEAAASAGRALDSCSSSRPATPSTCTHACSGTSMPSVAKPERRCREPQMSSMASASSAGEPYTRRRKSASARSQLSLCHAASQAAASSALSPLWGKE